MRLWHQSLIPWLPDAVLKRLHSDYCCLRAAGRRGRHRGVEYVFDHPWMWLAVYHLRAVDILRGRFPGNINYIPWLTYNYAGPSEGYLEPDDRLWQAVYAERGELETVYPEHNQSYLKECLLDMKARKIELTGGKSVAEFMLETEITYD